EIIPGLIYVYDLVERRNVYANQSMAELLGYSREEVAHLGDQLLVTVIHPDDLPRALAHHAGLQAVPEGQVVEIEYRVRDGSGAWRWLHSWEIVLERDAAGAAQRLLGLALDVTQRVNVEEDLRESQRRLADSQERWRSIAENPFDFVVEIDREFKYTYVNFVAPGLRIEDLIGQKGPHDFVSPPYQAVMTDAFQYAFREGKPTSYEVFVEPLQKWYHSLVGPIRKAEKVTHLSVLTRDITSEKQAQAQALEAEQQLRRMEVKLAQSAKLEAVGQLAGGIAHDFNNLLTGISGIAEVLALRLEGHAALPDVLELRQAVQRGAALTRQLLAFSRQQAIAPTVLSVGALLEGTSRMLRRLIGPDIELVLLVPGEELCVRADSNQLEQVLVNLAVNARDAMVGGGRVVIELSRAVIDEGGHAQEPAARPGPYARVSMTDTGTGMDEATLARIFEPFFTTKPLGSGTGLGLSMVHGIINKAGGFVTVSSRPGAGSTFEAWLPLAISQKPDAQPRSPAGKGGSETVLVVDDDELVLSVTSELLRQLGYCVLTAAGAEDALSSLETLGSFDLLLTDVRLPGMNGPELFRRISALRGAVPVVFMSGYADNILAASDMPKTGAVFLAKPFSQVELAAKVRAVLDS
ncbi:MAG TPA: PAS domain S-box protein, partial [Polyangiales bacterium]|nr:PAS domain S-box protein [Polyangiales bacterium]